MKLQLIKGVFTKEDSIDLLNQLVQVKIKFHENKISSCQNEEDIKMRENRIKEIQNEFNQIRKELNSGKDSFEIGSDIIIN